LKRGEGGFLVGSLALKGFAIECCFGALDFFHCHRHHLAKKDLERMCVWEEEEFLVLLVIVTILI
jgi:hypothetical protein